MTDSLIKYRARTETKRVILHDSHTLPNVCEAADVPRWSVLAYKGGLKMGLMSIGYHDIIERDGTLVECRHHSLIGSHTPGMNMDSIGVCLVGGREEVGLGPFDDFQQPITAVHPVDNFTPAQRRTFFERMMFYRETYPGIGLKAHTEVQRYRRKDHPPCPPIDMDLLREDLDLFAQGIVL